MKGKLYWLLYALLFVACIYSSFFKEPIPNNVHMDLTMHGNVYDEACLLTEDQETFLETKAAEIKTSYDCGVYVVTVADYTKLNEEIVSAVINLYHDNLLGVGETRDGILLLMDPNNREFAFFVYGKHAEYIFDDYGQELLEKVFLDDFSADMWYEGFEDFVLECEHYMKLSAAGEPVRKDKTWYYVFVVMGSLVIGLFCSRSLLNQMKSVAERKEAYDYIDYAGTNIAIGEDQFLYVTRTVTSLRNDVYDDDSDYDTSSFSGGGGSGRSGSF